MPAPANDNFANREVITGASGTTGPRAIDDATTQASEELVPSLVRQTIWYEWTAPSTGFVVFRISPVIGGGRVGWLTIWTGSALGSLTNATGLGAAAVNGATEPLPLEAVNGTSYKIQLGLDEAGGAGAGTFALTWDQPPPPANDDFADAITLTPATPVGPIDAVGATVEVGEPSPSVMFGDGPFQTTWYEWTSAASSIAELDLTGSIGNNSGGFNEWIIAVWTGSTLAALVEVASADLFGGARTLSFVADPGVTYRFQVGTWGDYDTATVTLELTIVDRPPNDDLADVITLAPPAGTIDGSTHVATFDDPFDPFGESEPSAAGSVWYRLPLPASWTEASSATISLESHDADVLSAVPFFATTFPPAEEADITRLISLDTGGIVGGDISFSFEITGVARPADGYLYIGVRGQK